MAGQVKHVIRTLHALFEEDVFDPNQSEFDLSISVTDYVNRALLTHLIPELMRQAPLARITVTQLQSGQLRHKDALSDVDLLFMTYDPHLPKPEGNSCSATLWFVCQATGTTRPINMSHCRTCVP